MDIHDLVQEAIFSTAPIQKRAITNLGVLNEAYEYDRPSTFSRGMRIDIGNIGDFRKQCRRTFRNLTGLLASEGATWHDVVRTSCYLRDIDRDYADFNEERTAFYSKQQLNPVPASTGIQAKLCRPDLLVEIEAVVMFRKLEAPGAA